MLAAEVHITTMSDLRFDALAPPMLAAPEAASRRK
jgi:hypothetical protein